MVSKEIVGIQNIIAKELENGAMKEIGSSLSDDANVGACITSVRSIVERRLHLKLLKAVRVWNRNPTASGPAALHITHANSVQLPVVVIGACAVDEHSVVRAGNLGECHPTQAKLTGVEDASGNPRRERGYLRQVSRNQRKRMQGCFVNDSAKCNVVCLNIRTFSRHLNLLVNRCELEVKIQTMCFRDGDVYFAAAQWNEAQLAGLHFIAARR